MESAAVVDWLPMAPNAERSTQDFSIAGQSTTPDSEALFSAVASDYFRVMSVPYAKVEAWRSRDRRGTLHGLW